MKRIACIFLFALLLCSCSGTSELDFFAMDTYMNVSVSGNSGDAKAVRELVYEKDGKFKKDSLSLSDRETAELADLSKRISRFTGGAFDITVSPFCDLWGFWNGNYRVPGSAEIAEALKNTGYSRIGIIDGKIILPENFAIDFGGIAKGYTGDCVKAMLKARGITSAIVSLGGNIQTVGRRSDGKLWTVGIKDPFGDTDYFGTVSAEDMAVVTSGGYERYFEENGQKYEHIIDPSTGYPANTDIASSTVISENGAVADALSTAFYVMGADKTADLCQKSGCTFEKTDFSVILILKDGTTRQYGKVRLNG